MDLHLQLEMPLEALLLRHLAAAAAGSLWACLAVLAAAFGLWRIRSAAVASNPHDVRTDHTQQQPLSAKRQPEAPEKPRSEAGRWPRQLEQGRPCVASPRKETLFEARGCYDLVVDDEDVDRRGGGAVEGEDDYCLHHEEYRDVLTHTSFANHTFVDPFCFGYINVLSQHREADKGKPTARAAAGVGAVAYGGGRGWGERWRGNPGWYLHQDMAALNGGVVRLWENEKGLAGARLVRRRRWEEVAW